MSSAIIVIDHQSENFTLTRFMQWFFAICIGTAITLASFVILPSLNYKDPVNPEPLVELEFLPWQKVQPEATPPAPVKKPVVSPKPKPKPVVKATPKPKIVQQQEVLEKVIPEPEPVPIEEQPIPETVTESVPESPEPPAQMQSANTASEALPAPVPLFQLTNLPRFMRKINPEYPKSLKLQGITGSVKLSVLIDATGKVRDIEVISSTHSEFAQAAIDAINNSSFQPADINGKPVPTRYKIPFKFSLQ